MVHVSNFWGCQGRRTGVGMATVSKSLILGQKFYRIPKKIGRGGGGGGGGRVGVNNILTFLILLFSIRMLKVL